jgi:hypothetical protein
MAGWRTDSGKVRSYSGFVIPAHARAIPVAIPSNSRTSSADLQRPMLAPLFSLSRVASLGYKRQTEQASVIRGSVQRGLSVIRRHPRCLSRRRRVGPDVARTLLR